MSLPPLAFDHDRIISDALSLAKGASTNQIKVELPKLAHST
jgi:hypothetical protein